MFCGGPACFTMFGGLPREQHEEDGGRGDRHRSVCVGNIDFNVARVAITATI
jgi:hypothetical protein